MLNIGVASMPVKRHRVSYLIKTEKLRKYEKGRFETKIKYLFRINRFQEDEARAALSEKELSEESVTYLA